MEFADELSKICRLCSTVLGSPQFSGWCWYYHAGPRGLLNVGTRVVYSVDPWPWDPSLSGWNSFLVNFYSVESRVQGRKNSFPWLNLSLYKMIENENENVCLYKNFLSFLQEYNLFLCQHQYIFQNLDCSQLTPHVVHSRGWILPAKHGLIYFSFCSSSSSSKWWKTSLTILYVIFWIYVSETVQATA